MVIISVFSPSLSGIVPSAKVYHRPDVLINFISASDRKETVNLFVNVLTKLIFAKGLIFSSPNPVILLDVCINFTYCNVRVISTGLQVLVFLFLTYTHPTIKNPDD